MKKNLFVLALSTGLLLAGPLFGQRTFRVVSLVQYEGLEKLEMPGADGVVTIPVSTTSFSQRIPVPNNGIIALYDKAPLPDEEKAPMLSADLTGTSGNSILLLRPNAGEEKGYGFSIIDDSETAYPVGSILIMNFMEKPILAKLGEHRVRVDGRKTEIVRVAEDMSVPFDAPVMFAAEFDGYGRIFSSSKWFLVPTMKVFCVIYADGDGNPNVRRIRLD